MRLVTAGAGNLINTATASTPMLQTTSSGDAATATALVSNPLANTGAPIRTPLVVALLLLLLGGAALHGPSTSGVTLGRAPSDGVAASSGEDS